MTLIFNFHRAIEQQQFHKTEWIVMTTSPTARLLQVRHLSLAAPECSVRNMFIILPSEHFKNLLAVNNELSRSLSEYTDDDHHTASSPQIGQVTEPSDVDEDDRTDTASEQMNIDDDSSLHSPRSTDVAAADDALVPRDLRTPLRTRYGKIPRLLKHDLRRFYPKMLVNVLNSQDHQLVHDFFHKFFVPEASLEMLQDLSSVWQSRDGTNNPPRNIINGRNNLIQYCYTVFQSFPDVAMTLQQVDIQRSNYDRHSQVHLKYTLQWTHLVPTVVNDEEALSSTVEDLDVSVTSAAASASGVTSSLASNQASASATESVVQLKPRQRIVWEKYAYEVVAVQVLHLNEEWYITHVDSMTLSTTMRKLP